MSKIILIDTRRYEKIEKEKLKPEDRRFSLVTSHNEVLFNENMLLQNRILLIALFALFIATLSLVINLELLSSIGKSMFITILSAFSLWLLIMFYNANKRVKTQNENVKNSGINSGACSEFLSTSKIKFAFSRTKVGSLRKLNFLSIKANYDELFKYYFTYALKEKRVNSDKVKM